MSLQRREGGHERHLVYLKIQRGNYFSIIKSLFVRLCLSLEWIELEWTNCLRFIKLIKNLCVINNGFSTFTKKIFEKGDIFGERRGKVSFINILLDKMFSTIHLEEVFFVLFSFYSFNFSILRSESWTY